MASSFSTPRAISGAARTGCRARSGSGDSVEGISWIEQGIEYYRATGSIAGLPMWLALKAEALYVANRTPKALEAVKEAEALAERFEIGWWYAELHRLRGVFLAALRADETKSQIRKRVAFLHHRNWDDFWRNYNLKNR
jgi:hypothetical protein